jgi:hypothetical protein
MEDPPMDENYQRFLSVGSAERIVDALSQRQHLRPHQNVAEALAAVAEQLGVCPGAIGGAIASLHIDSSRPIGRLRRTELTQLARTIHRLWRQSVAAPSGQSQPA